ncbi:hypothetical protein [Streptosporangium subroseum]|uniref:hypothetical protein n=1 Tax=Streptosporangium subroseum TaxID=106412 RepID=UPI003086CEE2|nr:hypothetical protein OHB15_24520 [Streptosporangium subroseum]
MTWAHKALLELLERAGVAEAELEGRWPLHADPGSGRWTTTARGSWTGGFWAGLLWLRATVSGDPADRATAIGRTALLGSWIEADTATRGLILWYGTAFGVAQGDAAAAVLRERAARACLDAYDPGLGLVPWGGAFGGPREVARVDGLPGLLQLLRVSGPAGVTAARTQLDLHLGLTTGERELRPAWRALPDGTWVNHSDPAPGWSRTAAWLSLAVADAWSGDDEAGRQRRTLLAHPQVAARFAAGSPTVPPARPGGPPDTSAAAIEAVAALKLAAPAAGDEAAWLRDRAAAVLRELVTEHLRDGRLLDGCYDVEHDVATRHELVWGDFFLAVGLAILTGVIDPFAC